ncbi:MAG: hypothetical protein CL831_10745 [Crocinitomicaceae bacterium]|nr:hypothetical protein [Crocinitomicaceae bacterium]
MGLANLLSIPFIYSSNNISITDSNRLYFVRYSWSPSDERIFYLDKNLKPIEANLDVKLFPGLKEFLHTCLDCRDEIIASIDENVIQNLLTLDETRGPQSFAFGHYAVDILPILYYLQLFQKSIIKSLPPLLIYDICKWHEDLHSIFGIPLASVFPLNSYRSLLDVKISGGKQILLYAANIKVISYNNTLIRTSFSNNLILINQKEYSAPKTDVLFLLRKQLGGRPVRWTNQQMYESLLNRNTEISSAIVDPARLMPSELVSYAKQTSIVVTPPGSSAYIPLHISRPNVFVVMPVSFKCNHANTWDYTLKMFTHYSHKLILVCNSDNAISPSSAAWDTPFNIEHNHLMNLVEKIISITKSKDFSFPTDRKYKQEYSALDLRCELHFESLSVSMPASFKNTISALASS